ncbi:hypothetical protein ACLOJK_037534 [Asimina triloba]
MGQKGDYRENYSVREENLEVDPPIALSMAYVVERGVCSEGCVPLIGLCIN